MFLIEIILLLKKNANSSLFDAGNCGQVGAVLSSWSLEENNILEFPAFQHIQNGYQMHPEAKNVFSSLQSLGMNFKPLLFIMFCLMFGCLERSGNCWICFGHFGYCFNYCFVINDNLMIIDSYWSMDG